MFPARGCGQFALHSIALVDEDAPCPASRVSARLKSDDHSGAGGWQLYTGVQSSPAMVEVGAELEVHFSLAGSENATSWTVTLRWMNGSVVGWRRGAGVGASVLPALRCHACAATWEASFDHGPPTRGAP